MDLIIFFVLGTVFGSFFNVLAINLVNSEKDSINRKRIISGRSHCPACNHQLSLVDLIPIDRWNLRGFSLLLYSSKV